MLTRSHYRISIKADLLTENTGPQLVLIMDKIYTHIKKESNIAIGIEL